MYHDTPPICIAILLQKYLGQWLLEHPQHKQFQGGGRPTSETLEDKEECSRSCGTGQKTSSQLPCALGTVFFSCRPVCSGKEKPLYIFAGVVLKLNRVKKFLMCFCTAHSVWEEKRTQMKSPENRGIFPGSVYPLAKITYTKEEELYSGPSRRSCVINHTKELSENYFLGSYEILHNSNWMRLRSL